MTKFKGHAKLAFGLWGYSAKANDLRDLDAGGNPLQRVRRGGYLLGERTLVRLGGSDERFITGFARYSFSDGDSTALKNTLNLGVNLKGPVESRPEDVIGLAWSRGGVSLKMARRAGGARRHPIQRRHTRSYLPLRRDTVFRDPAQLPVHQAPGRG